MSLAANTQRVPIGVLELVNASGATVFAIDGPNASVAIPSGASIDAATLKVAGTSLTATAAELNALASAVSGLGSSNSYTKTDSGAKTLLAAHATQDRGVLVVVTVDETFADGSGAQTVVTIGDASDAALAMADTVLVDATAGSQFVFGFTNASTNAITATLTAATGTGTGGVSILILALPNS